MPTPVLGRRRVAIAPRGVRFVPRRAFALGVLALAGGLAPVGCDAILGAHFEDLRPLGATSGAGGSDTDVTDAQLSSDRVEPDGADVETADGADAEIADGADAGIADDASGYSMSTLWSEFFCMDDEVCALGDVNADGRDDIVAFHHVSAVDDSDDKVYVGVSDSQVFAASQVWHAGFCNKHQDCLLADVDGQNGADIVALTLGSTPSAQVALSAVGGLFGPTQQWGQSPCKDGNVCRAADVNGDRRADLVAFSNDGHDRVYVGLSTGNGFGVPALWSDAFCQLNEQCEAADVNGDGNADLVSIQPTSTDDQVFVALSTGKGFGPREPWSPHGRPRCSSPAVCKVFDVDNDKRADIVWFLHTMDRPWGLVAYSTGAEFTSPVLVDSYICEPTENCMVARADGTYGNLLVTVGDANGDKVYGARAQPSP